MRLCLYTLLCIIGCSSCKNQLPKSQYPVHVGDIDFDPKLDQADFSLCDEATIYQYFNNSGGFAYAGEKQAIELAFKEAYQAPKRIGQSGMIRIRFVVNCKGETDRFRLLMADEHYQEKAFDSAITDQLLQITKSLKGWMPKQLKDAPINYYQYLIFILKDGQIQEILP
jgi:hypothetical protein